MPAKMYPECVNINEIDSEYKIYNSLKNNLDESYHVFHSLDIWGLDLNNNQYRGEADFVIFHRQKGFLVIEAKNGANISFKGDRWYYSSGELMSHGGPFKQAEANCRKLRKCISEKIPGISSKCKYLSAVWFHGMKKSDIDKIDFPPSVNLSILLSKDDLENPKKIIDNIFDINIEIGYNRIVKTELSKEDEDKIINKVLYPEFCAAELKGLDKAKYIFDKLLDEQERVLYYIEEQKTALINGAAGTGKTFIALKKAKIDADRGEKVLFLCYNTMLHNHLKENYSYKNIDYYTLDGLAKRYDCMREENVLKGDYKKLKVVLENLISEFPYKHIIIDEGQDFFFSEGAIIVSTLYEIIKLLDGTFYMFYDKNQLVQYSLSIDDKQDQYSKLIQYIKDPDCKLTLYKNCRNTRNIATTSYKIFGNDIKLNLLNDYNSELNPQIFINTDKSICLYKIDEIIDDYKKFSDDIVILTCASESGKNESILSPYIKNGKYKGCLFTTSRKFKGCEADIVILVDVKKKHFLDSKVKLVYYTGTSRARYGLTLICSLEEYECRDIVCALDASPLYKFKRPGTAVLASRLNSKLLLNDSN